MRIQHNIMAMSAYRNYTNNVSAMKKNLEKLSSGYKINRAGDDAAGLAISEKMRAQITGLETAQKNAKDGISLVQTAEGALTEVHDMLNRMVELATQSANGTYDNTTDRYQLQKEMNQLREEIDRIADSSNFNGIKLLDGSMSKSEISPISVTVQAGTPTDAEIKYTDASGVFGQVPAAATTTPASTGDTILHTDGKNAVVGKFTIALDQLSVSAASSGTSAVKIALGSKSVTVKASAASKGMSGVDIAKQLATTSGKYVVISSAGAVSFASKASSGLTANSLVYEATNGSDGTVTYTLKGYVATGKASMTTMASADWATLDAGIAEKLKGAADTSLNFNVGVIASKGALTDNRTNYGSINVSQTQMKETGGLGNAEVDFNLNNLGSDAKTLKITIGAGSQTNTYTFKLTADASATGAIDLSKLSDTEKKNKIAEELNKNAGIRVGVNKDGKLTLSEQMNAAGTKSAACSAVQEKMSSVTSFNDLLKVEIGKMAGADAGTSTSTITADGNKIFEGNSVELTINGTTTQFVFTAGSTAPDGAVRVALGSTGAATVEALKNAVVQAAGGSTAGVTATIDGNKIIVSVAGTTPAVAAASAGSITWKGNMGLRLQIGDTAEDFNQLNVNINDCHTYAIGEVDKNGNVVAGKSINDISIADQESAADAVNVIKAAINYVSDVRGTLGATQNRLDHTINNLSVMTENIQDAESTIRDVDVAEEMMAYTKNNILIQSAQAMLAQANQVPQGVLQLLQ